MKRIVSERHSLHSSGTATNPHSALHLVRAGTLLAAQCRDRAMADGSRLSKEVCMSAVEHERQATLRLANGPSGQVLTARVPSDISDRDLAAVGNHALGLIRRLTGCNCLSGRISFVVEDNFADV